MGRRGDLGRRHAADRAHPQRTFWQTWYGRWSPHVRAAGCGASALVWLSITLGLWASPYITTGLPIYAGLFALDAINAWAHRAKPALWTERGRVQQILDEIGKQIGLAAAALALIAALLKSYFSAKKQTVEEKPTEVAVVGSAFNPGDMKEAVAMLTSIKTDVHAVANMMLEREKREAEEDRIRKLRAEWEREQEEERDRPRRRRPNHE